jgi:dienelactone hydrolase
MFFATLIGRLMSARHRYERRHLVLRQAMICLVIWSSILLPASMAKATEDFRAQVTPVRVILHDKPLELQTLIAQPRGQGPFPVVLLTHGPLGVGETAESLRVESALGNWASDFARKGYLAVAVTGRSFSLSNGPASPGTCAQSDPKAYLDAQAEVLESVLKGIAKRGDADMTRVVGFGHLTGGPIMLALSARKSAPLSVVISLSGALSLGDDRNGALALDESNSCDRFRKNLISEMGAYTATSRIPTLWLYGKSDPWLTRSGVTDIHRAWVDNKGLFDFIIFPSAPFNGQTLFSAREGKNIVFPWIDSFLARVSAEKGGFHIPETLPNLVNVPRVHLMKAIPAWRTLDHRLPCDKMGKISAGICWDIQGWIMRKVRRSLSGQRPDEMPQPGIAQSIEQPARQEPQRSAQQTVQTSTPQ